MIMFNEIETRNDFADFLNIPRSKLTQILYVKRVDSYYNVFEIPKKNGEARIISASFGDLKSLQLKLADALWNHQNAMRERDNLHTNISHAFEKGKGIISNAKIHRSKRFVINLDLKDFFDSIHFGRVLGFFEKNKYYKLPHEVAVVIAQISCYKGKLPQGAPSSPIISNLICQVLDIHILKIAKRYRLDYTRYADDLTFSTNRSAFLEEQDSFLRELSQEIIRAGFSINDKKTRLIFRDSRQEVTGLIVNEKVNVKRSYVKQTKAMAHSLYKTGTFTIDGVEGTLKQLEGRFSFIDQLDHYNNLNDKVRHDAYNLSGREKEYQAFLFYKYFFANQKPVIITEGKTDIRYLQAALKNQYQKYPNLIARDDNGNYSFKVSFFHRSKRWNYFFGVSIDGGDGAKILYRYFTGNKGVRNLYTMFSKDFGIVQKAPIFFLFDNETVSKRPLKNFLSENSKITDEEKQQLQNKLFLKLQPDSKLYLLIPPLTVGKLETEIEDLFSSEQLSLVLGGKQFCRKDQFDTDKYYGKNLFSNYVLSNYKTIDFSGFFPLLDALDLAIKSNQGGQHTFSFD